MRINGPFVIVRRDSSSIPGQIRDVLMTEPCKERFFYLCDGDVIAGPVEDGRVVVLVLDLDCEGADVLQLRAAVVGGLHGHVDQLLALGLVAVEDLQRKKLLIL